MARFDPSSGEILGRVELPTSHVTACAFAGPGLDELYITTARHNLSAEQLAEEPDAGALFHAKVGVRGTSFTRFQG